MAVQISTLEAILKEFYLGPIVETLNQQIEMLQLFKKSTLDWSGKKVVIPVHVGRNTGVAYANESGNTTGGATAATLPTAGNQTHVDLIVNSKYLYGRFALSGPAIASSKTTANSFATYVQTEMDGLVTDVKVQANENFFVGQGCIGFIWGNGNIAAGGNQAYKFSGNVDYANNLLVEAATVGGRYHCTTAPIVPVLQVEVISLDDYAVAQTDTVYFGTGDLVEGELTLRADAAGALTMATVVQPYASLVRVKGCGQITGGGAFANGGGTLTSLEWLNARIAPTANGLYGNLCLKEHFGIDRNAGGNAGLRSTVKNVQNMIGTPSAGGAHSTLDFGAMQGILDDIMVLGGDDPNVIYMHPVLRQEYTKLLTFTSTAAIATPLNHNADGKAGHVDPGMTSMSFNNIPIRVSRHCGKGLMVFCQTKTFTIAELQTFGMADLDGNVLSRVSEKDEWEGFVRWYYDFVCKNPNRSAILVGINYPGAN